MGSPGYGYSLMQGYFLPPVSLTADEAVALLVGTDFVKQKFDSNYSQNARTAQGKIEGILPEHIRDQAFLVRRTIRLLNPENEQFVEEMTEYLQKIRVSILERQKVRFQYYKSTPGSYEERNSIRTVSPLGIVLLNGNWVLSAMCDLRQELRHFRLSRMRELEILTDTFTYPVDFDLHHFHPADDRKINVRIATTRDTARKMRETNYYYIENFEETHDGIYVDLRVRKIEEVLSWILSWGADVIVQEPEELRSRVREELDNMLKGY
ncbi:hypothetical protein D3C78_731680 [compost metagenome]